MKFVMVPHSTNSVGGKSVMVTLLFCDPAVGRGLLQEDYTTV